MGRVQAMVCSFTVRCQGMRASRAKRCSAVAMFTALKSPPLSETKRRIAAGVAASMRASFICIPNLRSDLLLLHIIDCCLLLPGRAALTPSCAVSAAPPTVFRLRCRTGTCSECNGWDTQQCMQTTSSISLASGKDLHVHVCSSVGINP